MTNLKQQFDQLNEGMLQTQVYGNSEDDVISPIDAFVNKFIETHNALPKEIVRGVATGITRAIVSCFDVGQCGNTQNIDHLELWRLSLGIINEAITSQQVIQEDLWDKYKGEDGKILGFIGLFPDSENNIGSAMKDIIDKTTHQYDEECDQRVLRQYAMEIVRMQSGRTHEMVSSMIMEHQQQVAYMNQVDSTGQELAVAAPTSTQQVHQAATPSSTPTRVSSVSIVSPDHQSSLG